MSLQEKATYPQPINGAIRVIRDSLESRCSFSITLDRDDADDFRPEGAPGQTELALSLSEILSLLPNGSYWSYALGWRSFFIVQYPPSEPHQWTIIGFDGVVPHPTRSAYPVYYGCAFPFGRLPGSYIKDLATNLRLQSNIRLGDSYYYPSFGLIESSSRDQGEHTEFEIQMLYRAAEIIKHYPDMQLRTLVYSDQQVLALNANSTALIGVNEFFKERLSFRSRLKLRYIHLTNT